jgi:endonuclease/exonuclease/phosphatase family metal-dependent hydrolase
MAKSFLRKATKTVLLTGNVIVALLLLAACYGNRFNPDRYWYFGLFTLAALYLLLFLAGFMVFWMFVKPRLALVSIITLVFCWVPLKQSIRLRIPHSFRIKKEPGEIRVMSWNVEHFDILEHKTHPERKQKMIDIINGLRPDIACFQEMVASDSAPKAINYLPDFLQQMGMYEYHYSYNPKLDFDSKHRFGIIIFSKYPVVNRQTISYPPHDYNSIFQCADIVKGTDTVRVFNLHLQSLKFSADNRRYIEDPTLQGEVDIEKSKSVLAKLKTGFLHRRIQSNRIREEIDKSPYPVIVCGDFNDVPNSYAYHTIGKGLINAFTEKGSWIGNTFAGISPTLRIDNIFADPRMEVLQYTRISKKLSDHFPVIADLQLIHK